MSYTLEEKSKVLVTVLYEFIEIRKRAYNRLIVGTPSQRKALAEYCKFSDLEDLSSISKLQNSIK